MEPQDVRRLSRLFLLAFSLLVFALDFLALLVAYLLLSLITPNVLGEVAMHPALCATSIALAKLPIALVYMTAGSWHAWTAIVTRGEFLPPPVPKGGRRIHVKVRDYGMEAAGWAAAALIVLNYVIDPGDVHLATHHRHGCRTAPVAPSIERGRLAHPPLVEIDTQPPTTARGSIDDSRLTVSSTSALSSAMRAHLIIGTPGRHRHAVTKYFLPL